MWIYFEKDELKFNYWLIDDKLNWIINNRLIILWLINNIINKSTAKEAEHLKLVF